MKTKPDYRPTEDQIKQLLKLGFTGQVWTFEDAQRQIKILSVPQEKVKSGRHLQQIVQILRPQLEKLFLDGEHKTLEETLAAVEWQLKAARLALNPTKKMGRIQ